MGCTEPERIADVGADVFPVNAFDPTEKRATEAERVAGQAFC